METTLIRGFVLMLALTGFGASSFTPNSTQSTASAQENVITGPVPLCAPSDPTHCGMD